MWGELWSAMTWGPAAVPALGAFGLVLLATVLAASYRLLHRHRRSRLLAVSLVLLAVPTLVIAVPHTFTNGTIADADEVNANFAFVESLEDRFAYVGGMPFDIVTSGTYVDLTGRTLDYDKQSASSTLIITYADNFGLVMTGTAGLACSWRLTIDGGQAGGVKDSQSTNTTGTHAWPGSLRWVVSGVSAGLHTFTIQSRIGPGVTACHNNVFGTQENSLMVEEKGL